jgi:general secretion pathway protein E
VELLSGIEVEDSEISEMAEEASVVRLVNEVFWKRSSRARVTYTLNRSQRGLSVRYRIDGMLVPQHMPPEIHRFRIGHHQPLENHVSAEYRREATCRKTDA